MPQISLYIDEQTFQKVQRAAAGEQKSLSRWVVERIKTNVDPVYPPGFEKLFGSVKERNCSLKMRLHGTCCKYVLPGYKHLYILS